MKESDVKLDILLQTLTSDRINESAERNKTEHLSQGFLDANAIAPIPWLKSLK